MKIKLAILDGDRNYLEKMRSAFVRRYSDEIEFYLFTTKSAALEALSTSSIDVFLLNKSIDVSPEEIPGGCLYAYLSDVSGFESHNNKPVICKFQRMDLIYKQILGVCAENRKVIPGVKFTDSMGKIILFCGASGGVGTSSVAAACAVRFAGKKKKVVYLNLQKLSGADLYFSGEGQKGMSDLILSLQDPEANLRVQLQSWVREDANGVCFYSQAKSPLDMMELDAEDMLRLVSELRFSGGYDYIILDMDLALDRAMLPVYRAADEIVMVGDHSKESSAKTDRALNALKMLDGNSDMPLVKRISLIYNRVGSEIEVDVSEPGIPVLGGVGIYKSEKTRKISKVEKVIEMLATMEMFDRIM